MTLGSPGQDYGEPSYWDNRYRQDPGPFDWYQKYSTISPFLDLYLKRDHRVVHVGCGNSVLGEDMIKNGYQNVINIDISSVVIEAMQNKFHNQPAYKCILNMFFLINSVMIIFLQNKKSCILLVQRLEDVYIKTICAVFYKNHLDIVLDN